MTTPYILDENYLGVTKFVRCDTNYVIGSQCKINCGIDSHFIVKDGKYLILDSMVLEGAKKGSVHVIMSNFRAITTTWRK